MFYRKIEKTLKEWKNDANRKPLIIKGCRQCGKTSSVLDFVKKNYSNYVYIDFHKQPKLCEIFADSLDVDYIVMSITAAIPGAIFEPGETCLVLDEIQECQRARAALKFFKLDGRFDVICTGSLLGVNGYNNGDGIASIPVGFEEIIDMYPMDFEEWLLANEVPATAIDFLKQSLRDETPVPNSLHNRMRELLLQYTCVGGMPEAVSVFRDTHDMNKVKALQNSIITEYEMDMVKYASAQDKSRIRECFESIPRQLSKDNKKFTYSTVRKGAKSKDYISSLQWIEDAGIVRRCHNLTITELPLDGNSIQDCFKVYMADTGLFVGMLEDGTQWDILKGNLFGYKGAIYENLLADIFGKMGRKLYYFQKTDSLEIDFIIRYNSKCTPVECKARTGNAKSLRTMLSHPEKYHIDSAFKMGDYNIGREGAVLTLPFYIAFLLKEC
ncbi:MAG: ATP-binding protein [Muribaculaceae bacterium]